MTQLTGVWLRDSRASDIQAFRKALDLMKLGRLEKWLALRMLRGLEIERRGEGEVVLQFLTQMQQFTLREEYSHRRETEMGRRDFRQGRQRGRLGRLAQDSMFVEISWEGEVPGRILEEFVLNQRGQLEVRSRMETAGGSTHVLHVYNRRA